MRRIITGFACVLLAFGRTGWGQADGQGRRASTTDRRASVAHLSDARKVRERLGLVPEYENFAGIEAVKIAVLDYGFDGIGGGRPYLPPDAEVVEHYDPDFVRRFGLGAPEYRKPFEPLNRHGRIMAQSPDPTPGAPNSTCSTPTARPCSAGRSGSPSSSTWM